MSVVMLFVIAFAAVGATLAFTVGLFYVLDARDRRDMLRRFDTFVEIQNRKYKV